MVQLQCIQAQADTASHRKVYAEINENVGSYKQVKAELEEEHAQIALSGWSNAGELRKIVATVNGEHGTGIEEYYLQDGRPLFVYSVYTTENMNTGKVVARVEHRYYFKGDTMIKWLSGKEELVDPSSEDFKTIAATVHATALKYIGILSKKIGAKKPDVAVQTIGVFTGIEEGDYFHWSIRKDDGSIVSFYILDSGPTVKKVLENPKAFIGKKCRVKHITTIEQSEAAGGKIEMTQIQSVEWIE